MFDIGGLELFLVLVVGLVVIGPKRLPEIARMLGATLGQIRRFIYQLKKDTNIEQHIDLFKAEAGFNEDLKSDMESFSEQLNAEIRGARDEIESVKPSSKIIPKIDPKASTKPQKSQ